LAVAHQLGMLFRYAVLYKVPVERIVRATIPNGAGKKDNERKSIRKRKKNRIDVEDPLHKNSRGSVLPSVALPL